LSIKKHIEENCQKVTCEIPKIQNDECKRYIEKIYSCTYDKYYYNAMSMNEIQTDSFIDVFPRCVSKSNNKTIVNVEEHVYRLSRLGPNRLANKYKVPSFTEKKLWRQIGFEIKKKNWLEVVRITEKLNANACLVESDSVLLVLPKNNNRGWNGVMLMIRLSENALPIALSGAHSNEDLGTGKQTINVFLRSDSFLAIVSPYRRQSSNESDPCKPNSKVTDNAHSMENTFFHALSGFADAFEEISFIEFHRCAKCGAMRIGRAVEGRHAKKDSFILSFISAAEEHIIPNLSFKAKTRGFYAAIYQRALTSIKSKWFEATKPGSSFFTRTNQNGRLLQGLNRLCGGSGLYALAKDDTSRFLHVEQQGGFSIKAYTPWSNAINSMRNSSFLTNKKKIV
jgi:hypothetical protein